MIVLDAEPAPAVPRRWPVRLRRVARLSVRLAVLAVLAAVAVLAAALVWSLPAPSPESRSTGTNALWARHSWVGEAHTDEEHERFAARLREAGISDVFAHVGPLEADGSVPPERHPEAVAFVAALHRLAPGVRVQAYLGQLLPAAGGPLRLAEPAVRDRIVATAGAFLDLGFDGIHYDIEPVRPGDVDFLDLLARTRELTRSRGAVLSVALEQLAAHPVTAAVFGRLMPTYGETDAPFLDAVPDRVDQLAIMTYDSGLPTASAFAAFMAWQTVRTAEIVSDRITLFMGVPTYDTDAWNFHPWAESVASAVHGLRRGLDTLGAPRRQALKPIGAAVFADWTTSDDEWRRYVDDWVNPPA